MHPQFSEIRSLLHGTPCRERFCALMTLLNDVRGSDEQESMRHYAEGVLATWPSTARHLNAAHAHLMLSCDNVFASLVHHLTFCDDSLRMRGDTRQIDGLVPHSNLTNLRSLDVSRCRLTSSTMQALVHATPLRSLEVLRMNHMALGEEGARLLARCDWMSGLKVLELRATSIGDGAKFMLRAEHLNGLEHLDISFNTMKKPSFEALEQATHLHHIESLELEQVGLAESHADLFEHTYHLAGLKLLNVSGNRLGRVGVESLAQATHYTRLEELDVSRTCMTQQGVEAIAQASHLSSLKCLRLGAGYGAIHAELEDVRPLLYAPQLAGIEDLYLSRIVTNQAAKALQWAVHLTELRRLSFPRSSIAQSGYAAWVDAPHLQSVRHLDLTHGGVTDQGLEVIMSSSYFNTLTTLSLSHNHITDAGLKSLTRALGKTRLSHLSLLYNDISSQGRVRFNASAEARAIPRCDV